MDRKRLSTVVNLLNTPLTIGADNHLKFLLYFSLDSFQIPVLLRNGSNPLMTADQLTLNQSGRIVEITSSPLKINLMELGFLPGKQLTLQYRAPSGGPLAFQLEETLLALRNNEAALIRIELLS